MTAAQQAYEFYRNFNEFQEECYRISADHGFHGDRDTQTEEMLAVMMMQVIGTSRQAEAARRGEVMDPDQARAVVANDYSYEQFHAALGPLSRIMLIVTEAAEAGEAVLSGEGNLDEELADIVIRVGDFAQESRLLLGPAIEAKMQKNRERPHMHGGKLA